MKFRQALFVAVLFFALAETAASAVGTEGKRPDVCAFGISRETTEHVFAFLKQNFPANSKCTFEGVETRATVLTIKLNATGGPIAPIRVEPAGCVSGKLAPFDALVVDVAPEFASRCADAEPLIGKLRDMLSKETALSDEGYMRKAKTRTLIRRIAIFVALAGAAAAYAVFRRRRDKTVTPPPPA